MDKNKEKILSKILFREEIGGAVEPKHHPDSSYKVKKGNKEEIRIIKLGSKVIFHHSEYKSSLERIGYYLGLVIYTFDNPARHGFSWEKRILIQVIKVSQPSLNDLIGTLRVETVPTNSSYSQFANLKGILPYDKWEDYVLPNREKGK